MIGASLFTPFIFLKEDLEQKEEPIAIEVMRSGKKKNLMMRVGDIYNQDKIPEDPFCSTHNHPFQHPDLFGPTAVIRRLQDHGDPVEAAARSVSVLGYIAWRRL